MRWPRSSAHFQIYLQSRYVQENLKMTLACNDMKVLKNIPAHSILESEFRVTIISFWILECKTAMCLNGTVVREAQLMKTAWGQEDPKKGLGFSECLKTCAQKMATLVATFCLSSWKCGCSLWCLKECWEHVWENVTQGCRSGARLRILDGGRIYDEFGSRVWTGCEMFWTHLQQQRCAKQD